MKNIIGIDIGGTKINGIVFEGGKILNELTIKTPKTLFEFERNLKKLIDFLSVGRNIAGIGIASAGMVDPKSGIVRLTYNIKFRAKINFVKQFQSKYKIPVKIDNDANCFARAELVLGRGRKFNNFLGIILGTGVGGGMVINKKIYRGSDHSGGEFGHMVFDRGFFEEKYFQPARQSNNYKALGVWTGRFFASLTNIFAPDAIILGGGVSVNAGNKFLPVARREMKKYLFNQKADTQILVSRLKNAGAIGAALLFTNRDS